MQKLFVFLVNSLIVCVTCLLVYTLTSFIDAQLLQIAISLFFGFLALLIIRKRVKWRNLTYVFPKILSGSKKPYVWILPELPKVGDKDSSANQDDAYLKDLEERIRNNPTDSGLIWSLAKRYTDLRDYKSAVEQYQLLLHRRPELHDARLELVYCYKALHQWDAALSQLAYLSKFQRMESITKRIIVAIKKERQGSSS